MTYLTSSLVTPLRCTEPVSPPSLSLFGKNPILSGKKPHLLAVVKAYPLNLKSRVRNISKCTQRK